VAHAPNTHEGQDRAPDHDSQNEHHTHQHLLPTDHGYRRQIRWLVRAPVFHLTRFCHNYTAGSVIELAETALWRPAGTSTSRWEA